LPDAPLEEGAASTNTQIWPVFSAPWDFLENYNQYFYITRTMLIIIITIIGSSSSPNPISTRAYARRILLTRMLLSFQRMIIICLQKQMTQKPQVVPINKPGALGKQS
jgi:hypothetical protein